MGLGNVKNIGRVQSVLAPVDFSELECWELHT